MAATTAGREEEEGVEDGTVGDANANGDDAGDVASD